VDGKDASRRDFSQDANPALFAPGSPYTCGMYSAARQTFLDREHILPGVPQGSRFNPFYSYAHAVNPHWDGSNRFDAPLIDLSRLWVFRTDAEPYTRGLWQHPGYLIVTASQINYTLDKATWDVLEEAKSLSNREAIALFNRFVRSRIVYDAKSASGITTVLNSPQPVRGACGTYANAFLFLCDMAGIPAIAVSGDGHAWAMVYVDGSWLHCDPTNNRILTETIRYTPRDPMRVLFAQEIVVPGSTRDVA